jgi:hypothetical protein
MEQQQKHRLLGITIIAIFTIIDGIAFLASGIAAVTVEPFLFGVDIKKIMCLQQQGPAHYAQ